MKAVINCEEVFDVLTRGPFPSGGSDDRFVEDHLRACHECRQLAEALRPAVGLFHESMAVEDESSLPGYRGALDEAVRGERKFSELTTRTLPTRKPSISVSAGMIALSLTGALAVVLLFVSSMASRAANIQSVQNDRINSSGLTSAGSIGGDRVPATLASLRIPLSCLPGQGQQIDLSRMRAANLLLTPTQREDFACCTRCHFSGGKSTASRPAMHKVMLACAHCHQTQTFEQSVLFSMSARPFFLV